MWNGNGVSLADIAAVTGNRNNGDGFGGDGGIWVLIILFALFGGWGNGYGNGGGTTSSVGAEVQRGFDTQTIVSKLDGLGDGICSLGYDQLAQMNNLGTTVMTTGFNLQNALNQAFNALTTQVSNCCCENRTGQMQIMNQMDKDTCSIVTAINQMGQNIMQNDNNNYRMLHDENVAARMEAKNETIAELRARLERCDSRADNAAQTTDILNQIFARLGCSGSNWGRGNNCNTCTSCG